jgi:hypothetical protein
MHSNHYSSLISSCRILFDNHRRDPSPHGIVFERPRELLRLSHMGTRNPLAYRANARHSGTI